MSAEAAYSVHRYMVHVCIKVLCPGEQVGGSRRACSEGTVKQVVFLQVCSKSVACSHAQNGAGIAHECPSTALTVPAVDLSIEHCTCKIPLPGSYESCMSFCDGIARGRLHAAAHSAS